MKSTLTTMDLRKGLGRILDRVALRHEEFILERKGMPLAALIPIEKMEAIEKAASAQLLELLRKQSSTQGPVPDADALADEAKHESRDR